MTDLVQFALRDWFATKNVHHINNAEQVCACVWHNCNEIRLLRVSFDSVERLRIGLRVDTKHDVSLNVVDDDFRKLPNNEATI